MYSGVPFLARDKGAGSASGWPYWGIYDVAGGDPAAIDRENKRYTR